MHGLYTECWRYEFGGTWYCGDKSATLKLEEEFCSRFFVVFCVALVKHFGWNDWQDYFQWQTFGLMHLFGLFLLCLTFYIGHMTECADVQMGM